MSTAISLSRRKRSSVYDLASKGEVAQRFSNLQQRWRSIHPSLPLCSNISSRRSNLSRSSVCCCNVSRKVQRPKVPNALVRVVDLSSIFSVFGFRVSVLLLILKEVQVCSGMGCKELYMHAKFLSEADEISLSAAVLEIQ